jgi:hypothetical protein
MSRGCGVVVMFGTLVVLELLQSICVRLSCALFSRIHILFLLHIYAAMCYARPALCSCDFGVWLCWIRHRFRYAR